LKNHFFPLKKEKLKLLILTILILSTFFLISNSAMAIWGSKKTEEINDDELQLIKSELDLAYDDYELKIALNKEISGITYGRFILNALYEEKLVSSCYPAFTDPEATEYFSNILDNITNLKSNLTEFNLGLAIQASIEACRLQKLNIGISTLLLVKDTMIAGESLKKLSNLFKKRGLTVYLNARIDTPQDHIPAWNMAPLSFTYKNNKQVENYFKSIWDKYGYYVINNNLDDFKKQQHENLRVFLFNAFNQSPNLPTDLRQLEEDGETPIPVGGITDKQDIIFKAKVSDPDKDKIKLQVELRRLDEYGGKFDENKGGLQQSKLDNNDSEMIIPFYGFINGDYHWRARAIDEHGNYSKWVSFGSNPESAVDFTVGQEVATPIITSPLKITPAPPYYVGDTINAEFTITNKESIPISLSTLTVGGRDIDELVADFTHRQNITLKPSESYDYKGTLTLNKVGDYHFFCTYQTPDGEWNASIDLDSGLTDEDRIEDIVVKEKEEPSIVPTISEELYIEWDRTFGGSNDDGARSIVQTTDDGYVVAGFTSSKGAGKEDVWVIRFDPGGNMLWDKTFGGSNLDLAYSIIQTTDGGYAVAGLTESKGAGEVDAWVIKLDHGGNIVWDKTFGGSDHEFGKSIIQTIDGDYIVAGSTRSKGAGSFDAWVIKLDHGGNIVWDKTFGGSGYDWANDIIQTTDSGYAIAGFTSSKGAGKFDVWVIKLDQEGNMLWNKTFGGSEDEWAGPIIQTIDGDYIVAGSTQSKGDGKLDVWLVKLDHGGNILWDKTFGGSEDDEIGPIIQIADSGYLLAGLTRSKGAGEFDAWVIKLDQEGNMLWDKTFGGSDRDFVNSIIKTTDQGYMLAGFTASKGAGEFDAWIIKLATETFRSKKKENEKLNGDSNKKQGITVGINQPFDIWQYKRIIGEEKKEKVTQFRLTFAKPLFEGEIIFANRETPPSGKIYIKIPFTFVNIGPRPGARAPQIKGELKTNKGNIYPEKSFYYAKIEKWADPDEKGNGKLIFLLPSEEIPVELIGNIFGVHFKLILPESIFKSSPKLRGHYISTVGARSRIEIIDHYLIPGSEPEIHITYKNTTKNPLRVRIGMFYNYPMGYGQLSERGPIAPNETEKLVYNFKPETNSKKITSYTIYLSAKEWDRTGGLNAAFWSPGKYPLVHPKN